MDGRPVGGITTRFLEWCSQKLEELGKRVWVLIWDNASWHISHEVRRWIGSHNREVKKSGRGVRIVTCLLPKKSPWLNAIEPRWIHGKRKVVEPAGLLGAYELAERVCAAFERTTSIYPLPKMSLDRALSVTKPSGERTSENPLKAKFVDHAFQALR